MNQNMAMIAGKSPSGTKMKLFSIELKYVTPSIPTRYPPKHGGIWGVESPSQREGFREGEK
jgi:hypothetical protein